jgi:hypothetical protein
MHRILNAEEVLDLMLSKLSLSRYDQKFFYNLQLQNVLPRKSLTTNQSALFTKVVQKYAGQLSKLGLDAIELSQLPWTLKIIQSSTEFTQASISIHNDEIYLRCPFKQAFLQEFREHKLMIWNRDERFYVTSYGLNKLKHIINCVTKHYGDIKFCETTQGILEEVAKYKEGKCWGPTLCKRNNFLFIAGINESLHNVIKDIDLNTTLPTLALLASYGISFDKDLIKELENHYSADELSIALYRNHKHDFIDLPNLLKILDKIGCDIIQYTSMYIAKGQNEIVYDIKKLTSIPVEQIHFKNNNNTLEINRYKMPVQISSNSFHFYKSKSNFFSKLIELVNNNPIELK